MPTIIDRYLLRQFIETLLITFMSMVGLYVVIDAFSHLDHFVDYADDHGGLLSTMGEYYAYRSLAFFDWMSGILALLAAMFTVTWIQRHHEMTALLAAGVPRLRVLRPILIAAMLVSLAAVANRELAIPKAREQLSRDSKNLDGQRNLAVQVRYDSESGIAIHGETIVKAEQSIVRPSFVLPSGLDRYGRQLTADVAHYRPPSDNRPGGYLLSGVTAPKILPDQPSLKLGDRPVILTHQDAAWVGPDQVFVISGVSFEFLAAGSTWRNFASTGELVHELRSPSTDLGADVRYAIHSRVLQVPLDITSEQVPDVGRRSAGTGAYFGGT